MEFSALTVCLFIINWVAIVVATGAVASSGSRSVVGWVVVSAFLNVLALLVLAILPSRKPQLIVSISEALAMKHPLYGIKGVGTVLIVWMVSEVGGNLLWRLRRH